MKFIRKHWVRILLDICIVLALIVGDIVISTTPFFLLINISITTMCAAILSWDTCILYHKEQAQNNDKE